MKALDKKEIFSNLVIAQAGALKRFAMSLCKNDFDANDLVSQTILKAYEKFSSVKDESRIRQWLFRILSNQFISNWRESKRFISMDSTDHENSFLDSEPYSLFEAIAKSDFVEAGNPEISIINKLSGTQIQKAINELPEEFRLTLMLCDVEGFTYAEIAKMISIPIGTVRSRIARARSILQKKLWKQAEELGIRTSKAPKEKEGYTCICGKEGNEIDNQSVLQIVSNES